MARDTIRREKFCFDMLLKDWEGGPSDEIKVAMFSALMNDEKIEEAADSIYEISETLKEILAELKRR